MRKLAEVAILLPVLGVVVGVGLTFAAIGFGTSLVRFARGA